MIPDKFTLSGTMGTTFQLEQASTTLASKHKRNLYTALMLDDLGNSCIASGNNLDDVNSIRLTGQCKLRR